VRDESVRDDYPARRSGPNFPGGLGRVKVPLATLAAGATLTRPARSRRRASTGATAVVVVCGNYPEKHFYFDRRRRYAVLLT
jgi:hypothetical protein